jgi:acetate CoA/acetoacetate CoA-transferase beta subunit
MMNSREMIARRIALELRDGDIVNLGIGLPTMVADYLPQNVEVTLQSENGFLGLGPLADRKPNLVNAGGQPCGIVPGASMFDSAFSFCLIRGGHLDVCILGGMQVDEQANLANWMVPGKMVAGVGGAMDLVAGSRKVIIAMEHCTKKGDPKILKQCTYPLTARGKVNMIVTDMGLFIFEKGTLVLKETAPGISAEEIRARTEAAFEIAPDIGIMTFE